MWMSKRLGRLKAGRLLRDAGGTFLVRICSALLALMITVPLARVLGPEGFGHYSVVLAVLTFAAIPVQFGIPSLLMREVSRARAENALFRVHALSRWAQRLTLLFGAPMLLLLLAAIFLPLGLVSDDEAVLF